MELTFEWDEEKARENLKKHNVSFDEGKSLFDDPFLLTYPDEEHSVSEDRSVSIGFSRNKRLLVVAHTERNPNIRIISCRKATSKEREAYEEGSF